MSVITSLLVNRNPLIHQLAYGYEVILPKHKYRERLGNACCTWGGYCIDQLDTARRENFPEIQNDWDKAEKLRRTKSSTGFEGFMLSANKEYRMACEYRNAVEGRGGAV